MSLDYDEEPIIERVPVTAVFRRSYDSLVSCLGLVLGLTAAGDIVGWLCNYIPIFTGLFSFGAGIVMKAMTGAVAYALYENYKEEEIEFLECLNRGLSRLFPIFILTLIIFAVSLIAGIVLYYIFSIYSAGVIVAAVIITAVLCGFLFSAYGLALQFCVVGTYGPIESLKASFELTRGNRLTVFLTFMVFVIIGGILSFLLTKIVLSNIFPTDYTIQQIQSVIMNVTGHKDELSRLGIFNSVLLLVSLVRFVLSVFFNVVFGSLYIELFLNRQNDDLEQAASVFR
jgi:hypothetical protein